MVGGGDFVDSLDFSVVSCGLFGWECDVVVGFSIRAILTFKLLAGLRWMTGFLLWPVGLWKAGVVGGRAALFR